MYKTGRFNARHSPPAVLGSGAEGGTEDVEKNEQTSSRDRAQTAQIQVLEEYASDQKHRFERTTAVTEKGNEIRETLVEALIESLTHQ